MTDLKARLQRELEELKTLRDEVKLQAKLGEAEAKKLWEEVEDKWADVEPRLRKFESDVDEAAGEAASKIMGACKDLYKQIKTKFAD